MADLESRLRGAGVRVTPQRLAVMAVLDRAGQEGAHLLATEVTERSREILGRVSPQTVYDCLDALVDAGLARRVALPGVPVRFESLSTGEHEHLACSRCERLVNIVGTAAPAPDPDVVGRHGFTVAHTDVVHVGLCDRCQHDRRREQS